MTDNMTDKRQEKKESAERKKNEKSQELETVIYIGPNRLQDGIKKYTVYQGGVKTMKQGLEKRYPSIGRLFVPIERPGDAMKEMQRVGTPLYLAYQEAEQRN